MRAISVLPVAFLVAGALLVAVSVLTGGATVGIALIVPFVVGRSLSLGLGVLLLVVGFLSVPLLFLEPTTPPDRAPEASLPRVPRPGGPGRPEPGSGVGSGGGSGGVVILGPVPILFGSWQNISHRARIAIAAGAAALFVVVVVVFLLTSH